MVVAFIFKNPSRNICFTFVNIVQFYPVAGVKITCRLIVYFVKNHIIHTKIKKIGSHVGACSIGISCAGGIAGIDAGRSREKLKIAVGRSNKKRVGKKVPGSFQGLSITNRKTDLDLRMLVNVKYLICCSRNNWIFQYCLPTPQTRVFFPKLEAGSTLIKSVVANYCIAAILNSHSISTIDHQVIFDQDVLTWSVELVAYRNSIITTIVNQIVFDGKIFAIIKIDSIIIR